MSKSLSDLTPEELERYLAEIARAGEAARVVGIRLPRVVDNAAAEAAAEVSRRSGLW